ncbi:MAG TPA: hypothetical protein VKW04_25080 [Planctomycetota bacterium]|nr:hypothetical protein [Planctomycetota bacterium]
MILLWAALLAQGSAPDLSSVPPDLQVPAMTEGEPAPGTRVRQTTPGWEGTAVYHALYLPREWKAGETYPVLVEYAGNGGYQNAFGDVCSGAVDGSSLGYGISGGKGFLWVSMPFVRITGARKENALTWWGDVDETKRYCLRTVAFLCEKYGGNPKKLVLAGFSRGSIACNFLGLHDDEIAPLWRAFIADSHYDGQLTHWGYPGADRASALARLQRLKGRPQFICMENSVDAIRTYVEGTGIAGDFTFRTIPFRNHSDQWVLRDLPERRALRDWLRRALGD